jgi:uncharacterized protein YjhX (UPF0386 family)
MKKLLPLVFVSLVTYEASLAQSTTIEPTVVPGNASACESNAAMFDALANILREDNNKRLFVVARLGRGETSREFNRRRLHNVRTYFRDGWQNIDAGRFVFAEGDRIEGEGRVEFYIGSELILVSLVRRGGDICVDCCDFPDYRYYGSGRRDRPRRRRR